MSRNKIWCKVRQKYVSETPEEIVRQSIINDIISIYNYDIKNIKLEYPVKSSPSDNRKSVPVDIAILENGKSKIFIETKKPGKLSKSNLNQLKDYMAYDSDVRWGILTNGTDKQFIEKTYDPSVSYKECFNIPSKGFYEISEEIKLNDLKKNVNLKNLFKNFRSYIAVNDIGTTRDEIIAEEIIKLVLCKTFDEKYTKKDDYLSFHVYNNDIDLTFKKISSIYDNVTEKYDEVFEKGDEINLNEKTVFYIVNQLQNVYLTSSERNVISDAFESIIGDSLKGAQGQFFTPKNVIKLIVQLIKPSSKDKILDPACGSGGFLIETMLYVWKNMNKSNMSEIAIIEDQKDYAMKKIFGVEKDEFLAKICKSYMAVIGDGKSGIIVDDSLAYPENRKSNDIAFNLFDIIMTNPPFGKNLKLSDDISKQFKSNKIDLAFLERCLDLLHDGGILSIILSEVVFHAPTYKDIRQTFFKGNNILTIIDLPHDTFRPYNNAKCIVIILQKNKKQCEKIQMIKIDEIGHDHLGQTKYVFDYDKHEYTGVINDDIPKIINDLKDNESSPYIKYVDSEEVINEDIYVPRYYFKDDDLLNNYNYKLIEDLISEGVIETFEGHGSPKAIYKGTGDVPYVRVKDIVNNEIYINDHDKIPKDVADSFRYKKNSNGDRILKNKISESDIVFVRRGSYRIGDVGQVHSKDINSVYTKELQFFKVNPNNKYGLTNFNLFILFKSKYVKMQYNNLIFIDTTLPTMYKRYNKIKIPLFDLDKMNKLDKEGCNLFNLRKEYWKKYDEISL